MQKFNVTGMSCSACQLHVEKAVQNVPGVKNVNVSLLTNSMTVEGDVSDKEIIKAVKKAGCEFVIIRIGYTSEKGVTIDKKFSRNLQGARAAGLKTGIYLYSTDNTEEQVRNSAKWIKETLKGANLDLPVAFDWEDFSNFQDYGISLYEINRLYDVFADELSQDGYGCML
jgi:copper chaperone CopZ